VGRGAAIGPEGPRTGFEAAVAASALAAAADPRPRVNTRDGGETPSGRRREPLWLVDGWREYAFE
jgi:hypothetical protein